MAPHSARRRDGGPATDRRRPIDDAAKARVLRVLADGGALAAAAAAIGVTEYRLRGARRLDPDFGAAVAALARPPLRRFDQPDAYLAEVAAGWGVVEAATRIGWEYTAVYYRRLNDPEFDLQVVAAARDALPGERGGGRARPVHRLNLQKDLDAPCH